MNGDILNKNRDIVEESYNEMKFGTYPRISKFALEKDVSVKLSLDKRFQSTSFPFRNWEVESEVYNKKEEEIEKRMVIKRIYFYRRRHAENYYLALCLKYEK